MGKPDSSLVPAGPERVTQDEVVNPTKSQAACQQKRMIARATERKKWHTAWAGGRNIVGAQKNTLILNVVSRLLLHLCVLSSSEEALFPKTSLFSLMSGFLLEVLSPRLLAMVPNLGLLSEPQA